MLSIARGYDKTGPFQKAQKYMPLNHNFILNHFPNKPTPNMLQGKFIYDL